MSATGGKLKEVHQKSVTRTAGILT